ncbi:MAG: hypothetical protein GY870_09345 [archaeon]|nr:hypothetical protein [archaeon]
MNQPGTTSKLIITFPEKLWLGELSRKFPYFQFEIKSFIPISQDPFIGNSLITITGSNPTQLLEHLNDHPSLRSYFIMEESNTQITINTQTKDQYLLKIIVKNSIIVKFPIKITKGKAEFIVTSTREKIDQFIEQLANRNISVEIKSIGHYSEDLLENELTSRQNFIYQKARELGYYDTPRKITLSELANQLDMAKSSLSGMLQRIHKKLLGS